MTGCIHNYEWIGPAEQDWRCSRCRKVWRVEWCPETTRIPTGRPEPCSLRLDHDGPHSFVPEGDCVGWHSANERCIRCDPGQVA